MRAFSCTCGQPLFFENLRCVDCGADIGMDADTLHLGPIDLDPGGEWTFRGAPVAGRFRPCEHRGEEVACNWMVPAYLPFTECLSCRTTRMIPNLSRPRNAARLRELEAAKRRVLFNVMVLNLPVVPREEDPERGVAFDFLETLEGEPAVMTGHASGLVTLNVAEADDDYRERNRDSLSEPYRTLVGHLRHELGHYYWDRLLRDGPWLRPFRGLFGDERADYGEALKRHYANGPPSDWRLRFISSYAASHPWEDWAETWAHYLHIRSTLETVASYKLDTNSVTLKITPFGREALHGSAPPEAGETFLAWINAWLVLTTVLNETARSMGQPDIYPFVLNAPAVTKLHFVHRVVTCDDVDAIEPPPETLQVPG